MEWKFESGLVGVRTNPYGPLFQRIYHVRYSSNTHLRRVISIACTYSKLTPGDNIGLINALLESKEEDCRNKLGISGKIVAPLSNVVSIMDFDINEKDQQPKSPSDFDGVFHNLKNDNQDVEDFCTLARFEKDLARCRYEKCVCTLTSDEEAKRRIKEIIECTKTNTCDDQTPESLDTESCQNPEFVKALKTIIELEAVIIQQRNTINDLKNKLT